ncbi:hypothetical protein EGW08_015131, partial [Elysia chlorotica]
EVVSDKVIVLGDAGHRVLGGLAQSPEDEVQLVLHCRPWEQRPAARHLVEDAANTPETVGGNVRGSQQDVWGTVPEGDHFVGVGLCGYRLGPCQ